MGGSLTIRHGVDNEMHEVDNEVREVDDVGLMTRCAGSTMSAQGR